jgi:hypothetical protein
MATTIRAVKTGTIRIRPSHRATDMSKPRWRRRLAIILDRDWTQPLPIYTYLIEHDEGLLLLDSGECARSTKPGWFPWWNPFFNCAVDIHVEPDDEIGPGCAHRASTRPRTSNRWCRPTYTTIMPTAWTTSRAPTSSSPTRTSKPPARASPSPL